MKHIVFFSEGKKIDYFDQKEKEKKYILQKINKMVN